jgi:hypothetical protein
MSAMMRGFSTAVVVGLLVGAAACGGSDTPRSTRTTTVTPSTSVTISPTPESVLDGPTVVAVRQLPDRSRVLVAYDLDDGTTRQLTTLDREDHPTVDAAGTSVVVEQYTGTANLRPWVTSGTASHLVLIDLATGSRRALTAQKAGVLDQWPAWNRAGDGWIYFQRSVPAIRTSGLWRVDPSTGEVEEVPHGSGVFGERFVLEPEGRTAWVWAGWCDEAGQCGGSWRLDLTTGSISRHPFDKVVGGDVAWTPDGTWFAYSENGCGVPTCPVLRDEQWPDGKPRTLLTMPPDEGTTATWHVFGQVGWHPDASVVVLQANRFSWTIAEEADPSLLEQRIMLVDTADGSATPIGPASVLDQSFDVWSPPATR